MKVEYNTYGESGNYLFSGACAGIHNLHITQLIQITWNIPIKCPLLSYCDHLLDENSIAILRNINATKILLMFDRDVCA